MAGVVDEPVASAEGRQELLLRFFPRHTPSSV